MRPRQLQYVLWERAKSDLKQAYIGNRLYELCMMQHAQVSKRGGELPYESFSATFSDTPKDTRTTDELRQDIADAFR